MNTDQWHELITQAALAPSVHNVQPARWRIEGEAATLFEDMNVRLAAADPHGRDAAISLGASAEGLSLAASSLGRAVKFEHPDAAAAGTFHPVLTAKLEGIAVPDPLAAHMDQRKSWRGAFAAHTDGDRNEADALRAEDCHLFWQAGQIDELAEMTDAASLHFMRDAAFRRELVHWMRLNRRHPRWSSDGLNAEAMQMSRVDALGVPVVLGSAFSLLDRLSLAKPLLSEKAKTGGAAAIAIFHRPADEDSMESGRHFYRLWLRFEAAGFSAAVLAALADHRPTAERIHRMAGLAADRQVVSAFRIGRRPTGADSGRARRDLDEILLS